MGLVASACGLQVFDLEPLEGQGAGISAPPDAVGAAPPDAAPSQAPPGPEPTALYGSTDEQLSPADIAGGVGASGGEPPAEGEAPREGAVPADAGAAAPGCDKVDFLFVIDNSLSMFQQQANLTASFPGFMQTVRESVQATDHHIMVIDTDGWDGEGAQASADQCEDALGAGKRTSSSNEDCGISGSQRYIESGQPSLQSVFSCLGEVGTFGNFGEQPMDAVLRAISATENGAGGCNAGFLREDAVLVVVLVTDEDDTRSSGDAEQWRQALLEAKGGDERAVVVLGFVGDDNLSGGLPGGPCPLLNISSGAPELQRFVQSMALGSLASVCAPDYSPFFQQAVANIRTACDELDAPLR